MTQHTAMVEVTLKPCPFCGDKAYRSHAGVIQCERCGACIANARAWNTRRAQPSITPAAELVEVLREARGSVVTEQHAALGLGQTERAEMLRERLARIDNILGSADNGG